MNIIIRYVFEQSFYLQLVPHGLTQLQQQGMPGPTAIQSSILQQLDHAIEVMKSQRLIPFVTTHINRV
jgi:hypothetical protein